MKVTKSKQSCIIGTLIYKLASDARPHSRAMKIAWGFLKNNTTEDLAYLVAYCRLVLAGEKDRAELLVNMSRERKAGGGFRGLVYMLWL
jgi:hypothetical protein